MLTIVGGGLAGTLAALAAEDQGRDFVVVDEGAGAPATRAAAGLFNPLTGPRFTADGDNWDALVPYYRSLEGRLGRSLVHPLPLARPLAGAKVGPEAFPKAAPGWNAVLGPLGDAPGVWIEGGGWVDLPALVDGARDRWQAQGRLEVRRFEPREGRGQDVWWCGGLADFRSEAWADVPGVRGQWQAVRGDVLTVRIPGLHRTYAEVGPRFLLPFGSGFRWGATHESDVEDQGYRPQAREQLEDDLAAWLGHREFEVVDHRWGVRPASRTRSPLVLAHPVEPGWRLFNGFGGRGVALIPRWLPRLLV